MTGECQSILMGAIFSDQNDKPETEEVEVHHSKRRSNTRRSIHRPKPTKRRKKTAKHVHYSDNLEQEVPTI